ncbi:GrpB family protein [Nonomuraea sp. B12E4]|uniref:GrpB family protein n=1 Tax=Nonomuraea sp. B12E4 TaxID=3153564 RepID=UPI00325ECAD8
MGDPVEIVDHDPAWQERFAALGTALRGALGDVALRIDHIGSTSVPGLAAKPVIDLQISVRSLEPTAAYQAPLEQLGLVYRANNPERTKANAGLLDQLADGAAYALRHFASTTPVLHPDSATDVYVEAAEPTPACGLRRMTP